MFSWIRKAAVDVAASYAKDYLTTDNITKWILDSVNALLSKAMKNVDADKLERVCETTSKVSVLCGTLSKALADKTITEEEAGKIVAGIKDVIGTSGIDDAKIGELIDKAVEGIKAKF